MMKMESNNLVNVYAVIREYHTEHRTVALYKKPTHAKMHAEMLRQQEDGYYYRVERMPVISDEAIPPSQDDGEHVVLRGIVIQMDPIALYRSREPAEAYARAFNEEVLKQSRSWEWYGVSHGDWESCVVARRIKR